MKFAWSVAAQRFLLLKEALLSLPVLSLPVYSLQFNLHCVASSVGVGAMLDQKDRPREFAFHVF